jgi:hypothetical protein
MDCNVAPGFGFSTFRPAVALTVPDTALIVTEPFAMPLAMPPTTDATVLSEVLHCTELVKSLLLPSEYVPVAVNCWSPPGAIDADPGFTTMELKVGVGVLPLPLPDPLPLPEPDPLLPADCPALQPTSAAISTNDRTMFTVFTLVSTGPIPDPRRKFFGEDSSRF